MTAIGPLIKRNIFPSEEEAVRVLVRDYILRHITNLKREINRLEKKYSLPFESFSAYLHARSLLLTGDDLTEEQRRALGQKIMQEEDDWLDWKVTTEMLDNWLGLQQETN